MTFNPLVRWVWLGGALMALGGLVVMWPAADRKRVQSGYAAVLKPQPVDKMARLLTCAIEERSVAARFRLPRRFSTGRVAFAQSLA